MPPLLAEGTRVPKRFVAGMATVGPTATVLTAAGTVVPPADVLVLVDAARLEKAARMGLFQPIRSACLERDVPSSMRDGQGLWLALTHRWGRFKDDVVSLQAMGARNRESVALMQTNGWR
jgi:hypothetical protein